MIKLLILTLGIFHLQACPTVVSWHGTIIVSGSEVACTFSANGVEMESSVLKTSRIYGLIQVSCDDCDLNVISEFQGCDGCWFCSHDEGLARCKLHGWAIALGVLIGLIPTLIIVLMVLFCFFRFYQGDNLIHRAMHHIGGRSERRMHKKKAICNEILMEKLTSGELPIRYPSLSGLLESEATSHRMVIPKPLIEDVLIKKQTSDDTNSRTIRAVPMISAALMASLIASGHIQQANACDSIVFMSSAGQLFEDEMMKTISTGLTVFKSESELCLKGNDATQESYKLTHISLTETYVEMYKACRPILETGTGYECLGNKECWSSATCHLGHRLERLGGDVMKVPKEQVGCILTPNLSSAACTYKQICVWYWWDVKADQSSCDMIYKKVDEVSRFHFQYTNGNAEVKHFTLSSNSPLVSDPMIFQLSSHYIESHNSFDKIRKHGDLFMGTYAAEMNQAIPGLLGDMQVQSNNESTSLFPTYAVSCGMNGHEYHCTMPESSYDRSLRIDSRDVISVTRGEAGTVVRNRLVQGSATVLFRLRHTEPVQIVKTATCSFKVVGTHGCTGCTDHTMIIIQAYDVVTTGLVPFKSNCSFIVSDLACSATPQRLVLNDKAYSCEMRMSTINVTLTIPIDYEFEGQIYKMGITGSHMIESTTDKLELMVNNPSFLKSLQYSVLAGFVTTTLVAIIKGFTRYGAYKASKKEASDV